MLWCHPVSDTFGGDRPYAPLPTVEGRPAVHRLQPEAYIGPIYSATQLCGLGFFVSHLSLHPVCGCNLDSGWREQLGHELYGLQG